MKGKISSSQAVILLLVCRIYHTVFFSPVSSANIEASVILLGNLLAVLITPLCLIPLFLYYRRETAKRQDLLWESYRIASPFGIAILLFYFLLFFKDLLETIGHFEFFITNVAFPEASSFIILVTFLLACFYGALQGVEGITRSISIIFVLFCISILMVSLSAIPYCNPVNFTPIHQELLPALLQIIKESLFKNIEFALLLILFSHVKGTFWKISLAYLALSALFILIVGGVVTLVLGDFTSKQVFPFYTVAAVVENDILHRMDAVHMAMWVLLCFGRVSLYLIVTADLLKRLLPRKRSSFALPLVTLLTFAGVLIDQLSHRQSEHFHLLTFLALPVLIGVTFIPLISLVGRRKQDANHR